MSEDLAGVGELVFSLVIGYLGALEFIFVVRHLYHWSCGHAAAPETAAGEQSLEHLQSQLNDQIVAAGAIEAAAGANAMQDGVLYRDGFRIDPANLNSKEVNARKREIEAELERQCRIQAETRKQLAEAEAKLAAERQQLSEAQERERIENERKLLEAEQQRLRELAEQEAAAAAQKEAEEREQERLANERKLNEAEQQRLQELAAQEEAAERARKAAEAEAERQRQQALAEEQAAAEQQERKLLDAETQRQQRMRAEELAADQERRDAEIVERLLEAERARKMSATESELEEEAEVQSQRTRSKELEREQKQKKIDENARLFLEAEEEMVVLQQRMLEATQAKEYEGMALAVEEPCIKKIVQPKFAETSDASEPIIQKVKTQFGQVGNEQSYSVSSKPLLFPGVSDDGTSIEPISSQQSSQSTQPSEELNVERQEPDGEDNVPDVLYTDEYLRSLDGIGKSRSLVREDGSGRRRAFKKRRSSGSSNSSRDSRTSREEELKMFTSLEEEEMRQDNKEDYTPIKYTNEPTLKVKSPHRRHKRSPAKDVKPQSDGDSLRGSLEMLGEENTDPWGEVLPEHYKNTEFWKREQAMSIDEEELENERPASGEEKSVETDANNLPKTSSFEEATHEQHQEAVTALKSQTTKVEKQDDSSESNKDQSDNGDNKSNLHASKNTQDTSSPRSSSSPRLRRSPRIDEIDQYEERWRDSEADAGKASSASNVQTPTISIQTPDIAPWRDHYGLMMEGLSDFYDFTASVNPSRSRSTSRNPSPANTEPSTPQPRNVANMMDVDKINSIEVYDDTGSLADGEINQQSIVALIENSVDATNETNESNETVASFLQNVADDATNSKQELVPMVFEPHGSNDDMNSLIQTLREQRARSGSRSRSRSPLPTAENLERGLTTRRNRLIKQNDELMEKLTSNSGAIKVEDAKSSGKQKSSQENIRVFVESLITEQQEHSEKMEIHEEHLTVSQENAASHLGRPRSPIPATLMELEMIQAEEHSTKELTSHSIEVIRAEERLRSKSSSPLRPITVVEMETSQTEEQSTEESMSSFIENLRVEQRTRSRSRSRSPLPTTGNIERSIAARREKRIQQNDKIFEKLTESTRTSEKHENTSPLPTISVECIESEASMEIQESEAVDTTESITRLVEQLRLNRSRSRSRSKSPLPNAANLEHSVESRRQKLITRNEQLFDKLEKSSQSTDSQQSTTQTSPLPTISIECIESATTSSQVQESEEIESTESITRLVEQLRINRSRSHSRAKSPLPNAANLERSVEARRQKLIARNDELFEQLQEQANSPESPQLVVEYVYETQEEENAESLVERDVRSLSPSRSRSRSPTPNRDNVLQHLSDNYDFHVMLNTEASSNKTLNKNTEEYESVMAAKQREIDREALQQLTNASEETELRLLSPTELQRQATEKDLQTRERMRLLRCSPHTPEYDRTFSEEMQDVERIKQLQLEGAFQRSTYVGESLEMGSEYEALRREAEHFRRSRSPSPSLDLTDIEDARAKAASQRDLQAAILDSLTTASAAATETNAGTDTNSKRHGAIPKSHGDYDRTFSEDVEDTQRIKEEQLAGGLRRSTYVGESVDLSTHLEDMRHRTAEFDRSRSQSRSPLADEQVEALQGIDAEAVKRELQDHLLDQLAASNVNFQSFSRHLNADFLDSERRASDSALIQKPELLAQYKDDAYLDLEPEEYHHFRRYSLAQEQPVEEYPDDYVCISQIEVRTLTGTRTWLKEDFYSENFDEDSQLDLTSAYSEESFAARNDEEIENNEEKQQHTDDAQENEVPIQYGDEDYDDHDYYGEGSSNDSEDERQTVVEIEDEFDEGISEGNERGGPTDESHHETSECEEAEREADRYANRGANDWDDVDNADEFLDYGIDEGAVGGVGTPYSDPDSFIEQIYHDAIQNRKQSGILRDYESIFQDLDKNNTNDGAESESEKSPTESDRYAIWAKTRELENSNGNIEGSKSILESERRDAEIRYLGDANVSARQSTRLRSRYGYNPQLQSSTAEPEIEVDLNYKPKREYNWRKNFKLDDDNNDDDRMDAPSERQKESEAAADADEPLQEYTEETNDNMDMRRCSLGGESITLFSRSPVRELLALVPEEETHMEAETTTTTAAEETTVTETALEPQPEPAETEKPKKKKSKKKIRKGSKSEIDAKDEDDSESQVYSRRNSSIQMAEDSPKRKTTRSRRSSKSSLNNEQEPTGLLFSPRSSIGGMDGINGIAEENEKASCTTLKKKTKKRKKLSDNTKDADEEETLIESEIKEQEQMNEMLAAALAEIAPVSVSSSLTPASAQQNLLANVSAAQSFCVTPLSMASDEALSNDSTATITTTPNPTTTNSVATITTSTTVSSSIVDTFDILKDANFYPLF